MLDRIRSRGRSRNGRRSRSWSRRRGLQCPKKCQAPRPMIQTNQQDSVNSGMAKGLQIAKKVGMEVSSRSLTVERILRTDANKLIFEDIDKGHWRDFIMEEDRMGRRDFMDDILEAEVSGIMS